MSTLQTTNRARRSTVMSSGPTVFGIRKKEHRGIADPDQAYILGELIRYLEHPRSGALEFEDMGSSWVSVG
jgi:hypothetical protein